MSTHSDDAHLLDIAQAARLIVQFSEETDADDLRTNVLVQSAILHQMLVLGEATKRVSPAFRAAHPEVPWTQMAGMRDRLIHGYDRVNLRIVWDTVTDDIPALLDLLEPLLPQEPE